uniref:E-107 protein n=1 Tax=Saccharomyces cerevisiae TaxID=4932 RepID=E9PA58_YEASX|nr:E-107 protein [Saccharomyces cerevisiae]
MEFQYLIVFPLCSETQANHTYDSGIIYRYILGRLHNFFVSVSLHRHSISKFGFEFLMTVFFRQVRLLLLKYQKLGHKLRYVCRNIVSYHHFLKIHLPHIDKLVCLCP